MIIEQNTQNASIWVKFLFFVFEKKEETYFKNGIEESYKRLARIDKKMEVKEVAKTLIEQGGSYLRHRSHVANIKNTLPLIRESFKGKYIEMDFSENIAMKPKFEVQDGNFSGKQYSLPFKPRYHSRSGICSWGICWSVWQTLYQKRNHNDQKWRRADLVQKQVCF